jgi:flagellar hook-associated protein 2
MSTSGVSGSGSVIDVKSVVDQLVQIERRPIAVAKQRVESVNLSISAMTQLKALVSKVAGSSKALEDSLMLSGRAVSSSDSNLVTAFVINSATASPGSYVVRDTVLAKSQRTAFPRFDSDAALSGTFTLSSISDDFAAASVVASTQYRVASAGGSTLSQWQARFTQVGGAALTAVPSAGDVIEAVSSGKLEGGGLVVPASVAISLTGASGTLEGLRDAINDRADLSGLISASIISTGQGGGATAAVTSGRTYRAVSGGSSTLAQWQANFTQVGGAALTAVPNAGDFVLASATGTLVGGGTVEAAGNILALTGGKTGSSATFSASGSAGSGLSSVSSLGQAAANATVSVNGLAVESKSNSFSEAIPGVRFVIMKADSGVSGATATVSDNRASLKERLKTFASDLTAFNQGLAKLAKPGSKEEKGGPLSGNSSVTGLSLAVSTAYSSGFTITGTTGANNAYRWADLGLEVNRDGSISIRQADLDKAIDGITSPYGSNREIGKEMLGGFTSTIRSALDSFGGTGGTIQDSIEILRTNRSRLQTNVAELELRVERSRKTLTAKYAALDTKLAGMMQLGSRVQSSLSGLRG